MKASTLRFRMMLLFCSVVGVLLAASYLAFWILFSHTVHTQLNQQLLETARPLIADLIAEPNSTDITRLNLPGEFFELLNANGQVLQYSSNLAAPLDLNGITPPSVDPVFGTGALSSGESVRVALIPFQQGRERRVVAEAIPTLGTNRVLGSFAKIALLLFPLSLLLTAAISGLYVGRSLTPITALTRHAAALAKQVTNRQGSWTPLPVRTPHDELGRLAETFNHLLESVDSAVRQLRQFVTDASHELRTPLSVLHGETELTLSKPRTATEYRETLATIDDELKKMTRIVEGLFTLSMADAGQLHLTCEPLYIDEVLNEACVLVALRARSKNIAIEQELQPGVSYFGDEAILHQLFLIFLDNAIKYSSPNTRIQVVLAELGGMVRIRFIDEGVGISPEHLPFIFERFYRAAPSNGGEAHSGGLGLAIAQAIVRAQSGSIHCESTPDVGSTFTILLPITPTVGSVTFASSPLPKQKLILG